MPSELVEFDTGSVSVADGDEGRTVEGYAYRWGELSRGPTKQTGRREGFERGAFAAAIAERSGRPWPFLNTHGSKGGEVIGGVTFEEDDTGLRYSGRLLDTQAAHEFAQIATITDEVSLELVLDPAAVRRQGDKVIREKVRQIAALAGVPHPANAAYAGATVAIREDAGGQDVPEITELAERVDALDKRVTAGPVPLTEDQTRALARTVAEDVSRSIAERTGETLPKHSLHGLHTLGEMMVAAWKGDIPSDFVNEARKIAEYALDDVVTTAGVNAALLTNNLTVRNVAGIVSRGRPAITAFGGPSPISDVGLSVTWPYFDGTLTDFVAAQSAQKAEITGAPVDIKLGTEALVTYAGGADIALQLIRQGDPSILDIFGQIVLTAWGVVTDAAFVTELESGSVTQDLAEAITAVDFTELVGHVITASLAVETATGTPAEFVLASTTAFSKAANLIAAASNQVVTNGTLDLAGLNVGIGNLRIIHVPSITAGKFIISNRSAARWHEAGPFYVTALDVAKLGQNTAYWSMGAGARYIPAGIIELYDVTP
jgi:phage head maturation protease